MRIRQPDNETHLHPIGFDLFSPPIRACVLLLNLLARTLRREVEDLTRTFISTCINPIYMDQAGPSTSTASGTARTLTGAS